MSQQALLIRVVRALEAAGLPFMVSGSLASSLQGEPRMTQDIDLVVEIGVADVSRLVKALEAPDLYLDEQATAAAVSRRGMFNLLESGSGDKVDFWPLTDEPFDRSRFGRRQWVEALGVALPVSAPEDTILMKLKWSRDAGGSEKQDLDALGVFEVQGQTLDRGYLKQWAEILGVAEALEELARQARPLDE